MGVIYLRTNKINGKQYVGQAKDLKERQYKWKCLKSPYAGILINRARKKYGLDAFDFEILKECPDEELNYWEVFFIKSFGTMSPDGYNMTSGGDGRSGSVSKETKEKISKKLSERFKDKNNHPMYMKHHTEESKMKMSERLKGRTSPNKDNKMSEEARKKLSEAHKGKTPWNKGKTNIYSEKSKQKMSEAKKGKNNTHKSKSVLQIDKNTNEVIAEFHSMMEVQRQLGFNHTKISLCCNNKRNTCGGYKWKYAV